MTHDEFCGMIRELVLMDNDCKEQIATIEQQYREGKIKCAYQETLPLNFKRISITDRAFELAKQFVLENG